MGGATRVAGALLGGGGLVLAALPLAAPAEAGPGPAPIVVTTTDDVVDAADGQTSLREAVDQANAASGPDVIQLATDEYYELDLCDTAPEGLNASGDLDSTDELIIEADGSIIEAGCPDERVLDQQSTVALLTVRDAQVIGGEIEGAPAGEFVGGGIRSLGDVTVEGSYVAENTAKSGAGIAANGDVTVTDSLIYDNIASSPGGGIFANSPTASVELENTSVSRNQATASPAVFTLGPLTVRNSSVVGNLMSSGSDFVSTMVGDAVTLDHATVSGNALVAPGQQQVYSLTTFEATSSVVGAPVGVAGEACDHDGLPGDRTSNGGNVDDDGTCGFDQGTDRPDVADLLLGPERFNGDVFVTAFPLNGSPVVDATAGPAAGCGSSLTEDQRGIPRPFPSGGDCDAGAVEQLYPPHPFTDVAPWIEDSVRWITFDGRTYDPIMSGFPDLTFRWTEDMTRAQAVNMAYNLAGRPPGPHPAHGFTDVPGWIETAVRWAVAEDLMTGFPGNLFKPDATITRGQLTRLDYRLAGSPPTVGLDPHGFSDVPAWLEDAVTWAAHDWDGAGPGASVMSGFPDATFRPDIPITRGAVTRKEYRLALTPAAWEDPASAPKTVLFAPL